MTTKDAIKHLSDKIDYAEQRDDKWVDSVSIKALYIAVRAMAEERKKGKWIDEKYRWIPSVSMWWQAAYECSVCGKAGIKDWCYCPNCGADMREEESDAH